MKHVSEITKIRRRVLTEVARLQWENCLVAAIDNLPEKLVSEHDTRYRCCEYKEKAIYAERIKLAMGLTLNNENKKRRLSELAQEALLFPKGPDYQVEVIDIACENCPINKFFITDACMNCLVHSCQQNCPKSAISIVQNQAYIDQSICVECGICKKSCRYGAIIEIKRPCEQACGVQAVKSGENRKSVIDHENCVDCGNCVQNCPFGAISERSQILKTIKLLQEGENVIAIIAPSIIGQYGQKEDLRYIKTALLKIGFQRIVDAALGADLIAVAEGAEFLRNVPNENAFLTSSCCPAFVKIIEKKVPSAVKNMSGYVSPMVALANVLKEEDPQAKIIFIGPCIAKKREALSEKCLDAVLTFEELACILVGAKINVSALEPQEDVGLPASMLGQGFAAAGGVAQALYAALPEDKRKELKYVKAEGVDECLQILNKVEGGEIRANYVEGMACKGGCLGGPGVLVDKRYTKKYLQNTLKIGKLQDAKKNPFVQEVLSKHPKYLHRVTE